MTATQLIKSLGGEWHGQYGTAPCPVWRDTLGWVRRSHLPPRMLSLRRSRRSVSAGRRSRSGANDEAGCIAADTRASIRPGVEKFLCRKAP